MSTIEQLVRSIEGPDVMLHCATAPTTPKFIEIVEGLAEYNELRKILHQGAINQAGLLFRVATIIIMPDPEQKKYDIPLAIYLLALSELRLKSSLTRYDIIVAIWTAKHGKNLFHARHIADDMLGLTTSEGYSS
jgi:hypothetical protein